jgi:lactoylglutathione lyase
VIKALNKIEVISLFVEDVATVKAFYVDVLGLDVIYEDEVSAVVRMENLIINLLHVGEAPELIEPAALGSADAGVRSMLTIRVEDANAVAAELEQHGVKLLNGPIDRPWGRRTAAFTDPAGNLWEIAQTLD